MIKRYGELASDPELYYTPNGLPVCRLIVKGQSGKFVRLVAFSDMAEEMAEEASKGDEVSVVGYFKERVWEDRDGNRKSEDEFVVKSWEVRR